jgi:hypothetical protein
VLQIPASLERRLLLKVVFLPLMAKKIFSCLFFFFVLSRPTFKTITPTSRTQLKTLLQREQLLQESERKESERKRQELEQQQEEQQHQHQTKLESQKVPLEVDVPPQILQVSDQKLIF